MNKLFSTLIFLFFSFFISSQTTISKIHFFSQELNGIELQLYNGLPRYGHLNLNGINELSRDDKNYSLKKKNIAELIKNDNENYRRFFVLVEKKFMSKIYKYLTTDNFLSRNENQRDKVYDFTAQQHVARLGYVLLKDAYLEKYFSNTKGTAYTSSSYSWGGHSNTLQNKISRFKEFTNNNLQDISNQANLIWPDDEGFGYSVHPIKIDTPYDINKEGYWFNYKGENFVNTIEMISKNRILRHIFTTSELRESPGISNSFLAFKYVPKNEFETKQITNNALFIKMKEIPITSFKNNNKVIYAVQKVKFSYYSMSSNLNSIHEPIITVGVSMESPIIEFYKDDALKNKISEISLTK